jgi:hypothetical protein
VQDVLPLGGVEVSSTVQALRIFRGSTAQRMSRGIGLLYRHSGSVQALRLIRKVDL